MLKSTDFDMPYNLNGLETQNNSFDDFCVHVMKLWISKTFGYPFFKALYAEIQKGEEIGEPWKELRDGGDYGDKEWAGLKALLIPIVYFEWQRETIAKNTSNGRVSTKNENSELADQSIYLSRAFNDFSDRCLSMKDYMTEKGFDFTFTYPGRTNIFNL
jgi:hypothetical protein